MVGGLNLTFNLSNIQLLLTTFWSMVGIVSHNNSPLREFHMCPITVSLPKEIKGPPLPVRSMIEFFHDSKGGARVKMEF